MAHTRRVKRQLLAITAIGLTLVFAYNGFKTYTPISLTLCLVAVVGLEKLVDPLLDKLIFREKQAERGAEAEETVGEVLDRLPNWIVHHDVSTHHGNIDHVLFRKDGAIFVIETKLHCGRITEERGELHLNGKPPPKDFVKQTLDNASWLKEFLPQHLDGAKPRWIHAAIVFTNAEVPPHCEIHNVYVIQPNLLNRWLERQRGDGPIAKKLWERMEHIRAELSRPR